MKNYVINLDRSQDRLSHCQKQFEKISIPFERVSGVDAFDLDDDVIINIKLHEDWPKQTQSEFACFMSHRKCWQLLANSNEKYAAIFEDDIVLSDQAGQFLSNEDWIPRNIDLLRLETFKERTYYKRLGISVFKRQLLRMMGFQAGAGGYILSQKLANELLKLTDNYMPAPVDHLLFDPRLEVMNKYFAYQLVPAVCVQELVLEQQKSKMGSLIGDTRSVDDMVIKRHNLTQLNKIKREFKRIPIKFWRLLTQKKMTIEFK